MLSEESLRRLRCPVSLVKLRPADDSLIDRVNGLIAAEGLPTRGGQLQRETLQGGLVTEDECYLYPIRDGILCMLADSAIELTLVREAAG